MKTMNTTNTRTNNVISFALVAFLSTLFAIAAVAQPVATPGAPIYVIPVATAPAPTPAAPACCTSQPAPQGPCCAAPLDERLNKAVNELQSAERAIAPLRGSSSPVPTGGSFIGGNQDGLLPWMLLGLLLVGALIWALTRNRNNQQPPVPVVPPAPPAPPVGPHIPINFTAQPLNVGFAGGNVQLGIVQQPPAPGPAPAPVPPAPVAPPAPPALAPAAGHCQHCGSPIAAGLWFCGTCGIRRVPALLLLAALMFLGSQTAMAQGLPSGDYRLVVCPGGVVTPAVCLQPLGAAPVVQYIPPTTGNGPSAIVPTAPVATRQRRVSRPASQPDSSLAQAEMRLVESLNKAIDRLNSPSAHAPIPAAPAAATPATHANLQPIVDRLVAVEQKQVDLAKAQNGIVDRFVRDETNINNIGYRLDGANDLAVKTAAGAIPKMSTHGGQKSPACVAFLAYIQQGGSSENPPRGCKQ